MQDGLLKQSAADLRYCRVAVLIGTGPDDPDAKPQYDLQASFSHDKLTLPTSSPRNMVLPRHNLI